MKLLFLSLTFLLSFSTLFCGGQIIDYKHIPYTNPFNRQDTYALWQYAFNSAPEFGSFFEKLKSRYQITTAVETGTWETGNTAKFFGLLFNHVHTIEVDKNIFEKAKINLQSFPNVRCYHGSSEKILDQILPALEGTAVLFYLDAHWYEPWPLLDELESISHTHRDNCIIAIDDFKVPGRPDIAYDSYGSSECSLEYIQEKLNKVFSEYDYFFIIPKNLNSRAKFIALPKKWNFKP